MSLYRNPHILCEVRNTLQEANLQLEEAGYGVKLQNRRGRFYSQLMWVGKPEAYFRKPKSWKHWRNSQHK